MAKSKIFPKLPETCFGAFFKKLKKFFFKVNFDLVGFIHEKWQVRMLKAKFLNMLEAKF